MREEQHKLLTVLGQPLARLTVEQVACVLNCQPHDVPILVAAKLLKPLGNPPQNGVKYFATSVVLELIKDEKWLHRATLAIYQHWHTRNVRKKNHTQPESGALAPATVRESRGPRPLACGSGPA